MTPDGRVRIRRAHGICGSLLSAQRIANARAPWRAACSARGVTRECVALSGLLCAVSERCTARRGVREAHTARACLEATADSGRVISAPDPIAALTELPASPIFMASSQSAYNALVQRRAAWRAPCSARGVTRECVRWNELLGRCSLGPFLPLLWRDEDHANRHRSRVGNIASRTSEIPQRELEAALVTTNEPTDP